ncbi:carboxynorspermidine decarboxylase [Hyphomicrobium sp.]|uniref:carboxynorspermidine decarboxylase n=1 Tax=Hyphomicrobium sp. TaxID=82 RepID=UPI003F71B40A
MIPQIPDNIRTPAYVLDVAALKRNLATATRVRQEAGVKILLATKAWAMPAAFPLMRDVLDGTTASGEYEARMGREEFGREVHVYAPAYGPGEIERLTGIADHIYANSPEQMEKVVSIVRASGRSGLAVGARINPGYSNATVGGALYDPCAPCSRFGTTVEDIDQLPWDDIDIFHVHTLCESLADGSVGLIEHVARSFEPYLRRVKAVNFGGGHYMNKPGYDVGKLIAALKAFRAEFGVEVYLEPGAGLVVDTGYLVSTVIGLHFNEREIAILDASASTHMPDVLEVPYTPAILGAEKPGVLAHSYILGGKTCMTGDVIGEYSFNAPLVPGSRVIFSDMMQYSFVKNTTFNGTPLPDLAMLHEDGRYEVVRTFGYEEFRRRLG